MTKNLSILALLFIAVVGFNTQSFADTSALDVVACDCEDGECGCDKDNCDCGSDVIACDGEEDCDKDKNVIACDGDDDCDCDKDEELVS